MTRPKMGMQSMQEAVYNHWYRAFMKSALQDGIAAAPVLREYSKKANAKDFVPSHRGFYFFFSCTLDAGSA